MVSHAPLFPATPRVLYERSPLTTVICQVRYPQILRIESQPPADFQDRVRQVLPFVERAPQMPVDVPQEIAQFVNQQIGQANYTFRTEDAKTTISLAGDAMSITTSQYTKWESFRDIAELAIISLVDIYKPSFFSRIGLRYHNVIHRNRLGLAGQQWSTLLRPELLGEIMVEPFKSGLIDTRRMTRIKAPAIGGTILLQHGLLQSRIDKEIGYLIDFDFFTDEKANSDDALSIIDRFNKSAGSAFRWCITDELHNGLGPRLVR